MSKKSANNALFWLEFLWLSNQIPSYKLANVFLHVSKSVCFLKTRNQAMVTAAGLRCSVLIMKTLRQQQILPLVKNNSIFNCILLNSTHSLESKNIQENQKTPKFV